MGTDESPSSNPVDVFNLAARWRPGPEWNKIEQGIDSEPVPSHINTINSSGLFHIVSADKMSVRYGGNQQLDHGVGVVQADCAAPVKRTAYYFEMTVKNAGLKGQMVIGFTNQQFKMRRQPGWDTNSCGYHGDDGYLYRGYGIGESFGPTFTAGDTVGAGINYASQEFFFTKNENLVGTVIKDIKGPLYPTVAVNSQNEEVIMNFGKQPFLFDIEAYVMEEKTLQQQETLEKLSLCQSLLIKNGDINSAFEKLREWYPQMVQVGNLEDAITYAQAQLAKYFNVRPFSELLGDVVALLAYGEPLESCVGYLLNTSQREFVADAVNAVILSTNPDLEDAENCMQTCLEKLLRQLTLCSLEYRALTGDQGESFLLHRELASSARGKRS